MQAVLNTPENWGRHSPQICWPGKLVFNYNFHRSHFWLRKNLSKYSLRIWELLILTLLICCLTMWDRHWFSFVALYHRLQYQGVSVVVKQAFVDFPLGESLLPSLSTVSLTWKMKWVFVRLSLQDQKETVNDVHWREKATKNVLRSFISSTAVSICC